MFRVRTVTDVEDFVGLPGDPEDYAEVVSGLWDSGGSRPEWCFLIEDGSTKVGRIGFRVEPTVSDLAWVGSLPPEELFVYGLDLPWEGDYLDPGRRLITEATAGISAEVPGLLEVRVNSSIHSYPEERRRVLTACGMDLFQEKIGFSWSDEGGGVDAGDRLRYRSISDVGLETYREVMAPCGKDTLDRNDRYYWTGCGPDNWAAQMTVYLEEEDAEMWLVGYRDGDSVGYVAIASVEDWGSTIAHIGVQPQYRGHGYIHDLLTAGTAAARKSGITGMLSDVDVLNTPMRKAMHRAGHIEDPERWHLWVYRTNIPNESL